MSARIYVYSNTCTRATQVCRDLDRYTHEDGSISDDIELWGTGEEEELAVRAVAEAQSAKPLTTAWSRARNVAEYLQPGWEQ
jgi:hypothetical protein